MRPPTLDSLETASSLLVEMCLSPALVLAASSFLVATASFEGDSRDGISIPIAKRSGIRNSGDVVDIAKLQAGLRRTVALVFYIFAGRLTTGNTPGIYSTASRHLRRIQAQLTLPS